MPMDDMDRRTRNDEGHEGTIDAAVVRELTQHVRWSAQALGKIEGLLGQITKTSDTSQSRIEGVAKELQENQARELVEMKTLVVELSNRMGRLEGTVRELKITDEGLVQECNRKWEKFPVGTTETTPTNVPPSESLSTTTPTIPTTLTTWYSQLLMGLFKQPIYLAIAGLIVAFVILALALSDDLRALLGSFSG